MPGTSSPATLPTATAAWASPSTPQPTMAPFRHFPESTMIAADVGPGALIFARVTHRICLTMKRLSRSARGLAPKGRMKVARHKPRSGPVPGK